jgi:hypothetical protein
MSHKYEKNANGVDCLIETYHRNGQLASYYEWNHDKTQTCLVATKIDCRYKIIVIA